jgi:tetratricopeptide (TPR) repeat protein
MYRRRYSVLFLLCAALGPLAAAQTPPSKYTNEPFVIESLTSRFVFETDGTCVRDTTSRIRVQSEAGVQAFGILNFSYEKDSEDVTMDYVRVRKPDRTTVVTPPADVQDLDTEVSRVAPMYSDQREKHVAVKNLSIGDVIEYHFITRISKSAAPGQFWTTYAFFRDGIILDEQVEISVPREQYVKVKSADVQPSIAEEGDRKVYRWKTANLQRKTDEEKAKQSKREAPPPSIQLTTFRTWEEIAKWYAELQRDRIKPGDEVRAKALELTKAAKTELEKLRAIYKYVSQDFRYIGLEFGVGRYQPHSADEVFKNRYGDCKDKHTLLAALLQAVGIKASAVLINSTRKVDEDIPSPSQFNHVISIAQVGGQAMWMDTTPEVAPFGLLIWGLRDKKALVTGDQPEWRKTPANTPMESFLRFEAEGKLSPDGELEARITRTMRGDAEIAWRAGFRAVGQPEWKELLQRLSYSTGFAGTVSDPKVSSPTNTDEPLRITYEYKRKDFGDWPNRRIIAFAAPAPLFSVDDEDKSDDPIILGGPFRMTSKTKLELPSGYKPELPNDVESYHDYSEYRSQYEFKDGAIIYERELNVRIREIPASRREEYKKFAKIVIEDQSSFIPLNKITEDALADAAAAVGKSLGFPGVVDARSLYVRGREQMQGRNMKAALELFRRTAEADPKFPGVWSAIGLCQMLQGQAEEAVKSFRREVSQQPADQLANQSLVQALNALKRYDESTAVMQAYVKLAPADTEATTGLAEYYFQHAKYQQAAEILQAALKEDAHNAELLRQLGGTYTKLGKNEEAIAALRQAVDAQPDDTFNLVNAAFYLAEAGVYLDEAEQWAMKGVKIQEAKTEDVDLDKLTTDDLLRVVRIAGCWNTLGWVYFHRGDLQKAEAYLRPAWALSQLPVIGEHLAQVYEKQGKKLLAAKTYAQSIQNSSPTERSPGLAGSNTAKLRLDALVGPSTAATLINKAGEELSLARSIRVPNFVKGVGSGEFFLLLGPGKKVATKFISGESSLRKSENALAAALAGKLVPDEPGGEPVKIVRRAIVICHESGNYCELVLMTPASVTSLN